MQLAVRHGPLPDLGFLKCRVQLHISYHRSSLLPSEGPAPNNVRHSSEASSNISLGRVRQYPLDMNNIFVHPKTFNRIADQSVFLTYKPKKFKK